MKNKIITFLFWLTVTAVYILFPHKYDTHVNTNCLVLDKMEQGGGRKSHDRYLLVLKTEKNIVFDLEVETYVYSQCKEGDILTFNLRPMDIRQTIWGNIYVMVRIFIIIIIGFMTIYYACEIFSKDN